MFQFELTGYSTANLREFASRTMYVLNSIPQEDWPSPRMLGEWLFHRLKQVRKSERVIDEIQRSASNSHMRDFEYHEYLWDYLQEYLVEEREDQNALSSLLQRLLGHLPKLCLLSHHLLVMASHLQHSLQLQSPHQRLKVRKVKRVKERGKAKLL